MSTARIAALRPGREAAAESIPPVTKPLLRLFAKYTDFYIARNFHGMRLSWSDRPTGLDGKPLLVCMNHPSWWDPLFALSLTQRLFPERSHYAPIEAQALTQYRFFEKLGFFGIEPGTVRGGARFLRMGSAILNGPDRALWVTVQGEFTDVRKRPVRFRSGVGHLAHRLQNCAVIPLALEYTHWNERLPEALARFGPPVLIEDGRAETPDQWLQRLEGSLERTQDRLAEDALARDPAAFETLVSGAAGVGGFYDMWRAMRAKLRGESFDREHRSVPR